MYKSSVQRNYKSGLQTNRIPLNLEQDAFASLFNAYVWRGRIKKKPGSSLLARLSNDAENVSIGNSGASDWTINTIFTASSIGASDTNKDLIAGSLVITIAAGPDIVFTDQGDGNLVSDTAMNSGTVNYATGEVVLTHTAGAGVATTATFLWAPTYPVMGLAQKPLDVINESSVYAFDTKYAYEYNNAGKKFISAPSTLVTTWSGNDYQFFQTANAYKALWATNTVPGIHGFEVSDISPVAGDTIVTTTTSHNVEAGDQIIFFNGSSPLNANNGFRADVAAAPAPTANTFAITSPDGKTFTTGTATIYFVVSNRNVSGDGIRWYDGTTWMNFNPVVNPTTVLCGCSMIFYYRGRIVVLDTKEATTVNPDAATRYPQRARYSQLGTPFEITPVPTGSGAGTIDDAWREDVPGRGGFIDAPTDEEIVSAYFLRDTLVVGFENSTWKLLYTNNRLLPFVWERLNVELGALGRLCGIGFDKNVLFVGPRGIYTSDGVGADRIDMMIPQLAFDLRNINNGDYRICGIRDYNEQVAMWTIPSSTEADNTFPNQVLLYNYVDASWAILNDSFTCYGYWQPFFDLTWADADFAWEDADFPWTGGVNDYGSENVIAGNQQGFVMNPLSRTSNDTSLKVDGVTVAAGVATKLTVLRHNLSSGTYVQASGFLEDNAVLNTEIFNVTVVDSDTISLYQYIDGRLEEYTGGSATYTGNGKLSVIDNFQVLTKTFNPFLDESVSVRMKQIDFYVDATETGRFRVNLYTNNSISPANPISEDNALSNAVETYPNPYEAQNQDKLWHAHFETVTGNLFQIELQYGDSDMADSTIWSQDVVVHSIAPQSQAASRRLT